MPLANIKAHIFKRTKTNATSYPASDMVNDLNNAQGRAAANIRKFVHTYRPTAWTTGDLSTGTKTPDFDADYHELIELYVEEDYGIENDSAWLAGVQRKILILEDMMKRFYAARNYREVAITNASPAVMTSPNHRLIQGQRVLFVTLGGTINTGITADTWYYVIGTNLGPDTFEISATKDGAAINTTGAQTGSVYVATDQNRGFGLRTNSGGLADSNK